MYMCKLANLSFSVVGSVSSNIAQAFLMPVLDAFFHGEVQVRLGAVQAMVLILRQGLVHPAQVCVCFMPLQQYFSTTPLESQNQYINYVHYQRGSMCAANEMTCLHVRNTIFLQCVPYLIAMSTDSESSVKLKADQQLSDHCSRYGHFMQVCTQCC